MPRKRRTPQYCLHRSTGRAYTRIEGRWINLGKHGTPESQEKYHRLISEWHARGQAPPDDRKAEPSELTVNELLIRYYRFCQRHYGSRRTAAKRLSAVRQALSPVRQLFGTSAAESFGPRSLVLVRDAFVARGLSRKTINDNVQVIKRMFKWAVREEIVPPSLHHGLSAVEGLRAGESPAPEPRKVQPVPREHVATVLPGVLPPVRAMIELQRLTGMRPGEVTIMRTGDLDMNGAVWLYRPRQHKGDRHGLGREIHLGPRAQGIVREFFRPNIEEFMFRPDEAEADRDAERRAHRKTPLWPSSLKRQRLKRKKAPKRAPGDHYSVDSYAQAIRRACERLGIPVWSPHRLRHSYATRIRREYGVEAARVMLGHRHVGVTELYAERDLAVGATIAEKHG